MGKNNKDFIGNINDYIIDILLNDPINEYRKIEDSSNNLIDIKDIKLLYEFKRKRTSSRYETLLKKKEYFERKNLILSKIRLLLPRSSLIQPSLNLKRKRNSSIIISTQPSPTHPSPTQPSPRQPSPTHPSPTQPSPSQSPMILSSSQSSVKSSPSSPSSAISTPPLSRQSSMRISTPPTSNKELLTKTSQNLKRKRSSQNEESKRLKVIRGNGNKMIQYGSLYQKYIRNLYIYDNYHDFSGKSGPKNISIPQELLLKTYKPDSLKSSSIEKIFFTNALIDLLKENKSIFLKYHYINLSNPKKLYTDQGNKFENIDTLKLQSILNNNLQFTNNRIIYDGIVSKGALKPYKNLIEGKYKPLTTAEVIFDPMNTSMDDYKSMKEYLKVNENLLKYSENTNKIFNTKYEDVKGLTDITEIDMLSAFNEKTRDFFNIVYYKIKEKEYSVALLLKNKKRNIYTEYNKNNKKPNFLKFLEKNTGSDIYNEINEINIQNNNNYLAFDIAELHIGNNIELINSVNNIKMMINTIYDKYKKHEKDEKDKLSNIRDYMVSYLYENNTDNIEKEKERAIEILFDLKKAGDYGKVLLCFYNNIKSDKEKYLLTTNDTLCALNGILRKNINVIFGATENNDKRLCFYSCCNDSYGIKHVINILELSFKLKIDEVRFKDIDKEKEINNVRDGEIILAIIEDLNEQLIEKYNKIFKTLQIKYGNGKNDNIKLNEEEIKSLIDQITNIKDKFIENVKVISSTDVEVYSLNHKKHFNDYICNIDNLVTIYENIIIRNNDIIKIFNNYISLLNRTPLNILQILISNPDRIQRDIAKDPFKKISDCIKGNDKSNFSKANCIANYYILNSKKIKINIDKLTNLLEIFIINIIESDYDNNIKLIIYKLYYFNIKKIYIKIFVDKNYDKNTKNIYEFLPYLIELFKKYLKKKIDTDGSDDIKMIIRIVLEYLEEFKVSFYNISKKLENINKNLDSKIPKELLELINNILPSMRSNPSMRSSPSMRSNPSMILPSKTKINFYINSFFDYIIKYFRKNE